jgi:protease YdgD
MWQWPTAGWAAGVFVGVTLTGVGAALADVPMLHRVAVFGADDRGPLPARYQALAQSIGVLFNVRARSVCSAFCVSNDTIATAGHCLFKTAGEVQPRLQDYWFARNYDQTRDYARIAGHQSTAANQSVIAGSTQLQVRPPIDATSDWALVKLVRPICKGHVLPVRRMTPDALIQQSATRRIFQVSYHRDYQSWKLAYSKPCTLGRDFKGAPWATIAADFSSPQYLVLHTCDTGGASSGSPILIDEPAGVSVVGINVGTYVQARGAPQTEATGKGAADPVANTAITADVFMPALETMKSATVLIDARDIRTIQDKLKGLGLFAGASDGTFGAETRTAITRFERENGMTATGLPTAALAAKLGVSVSTPAIKR